ncbi:MAG TPA: desulfoferrodoxin [Actinobacteria bacterium]|nr:desulfoferrodoxin [Actinomycetota bacterium]
MTKLLEIYKCEVCGNIVEMLHGGFGEMICCKQPMKLYEENTVDAALEKHVPVFEVADNTVNVKIGSVLHPMEEKHYIEWIEIIDEDGRAYRKFLKPGNEPVAQFCIKPSGRLTVREYCNLHGLWKA